MIRATRRPRPTGALLLAAGGLLGCAQTPTMHRGQLALELTAPGTPPARTFDGKPVSLRALRADGPVMLVFLRGFS